MTLIKDNSTIRQREVENKKERVSEDKAIEGWDLFDPNSYYETEDLDVFSYFLNSKGTKTIEANFKVDRFTLVARAGNDREESSVFFHTMLTKISRPRKIELVENVYSLPGVGNIAKNRLGATLSAYLGVEKK